MKFLIAMISLFSLSYNASASERVISKWTLTPGQEALRNFTDNCTSDDASNMSKADLIKRLKQRKLDLESAYANEALFKELALDTSKAANRINILGTTSEVALLVLSGGALEAGLGALAGVGAGAGIGNYEALTAEDPDAVVEKNLAASELFSKANCSYQEMYEKLATKRSELYSELDDKMFNVKNAIRFGKTMKNHSISLYALTAFKRELIQTEITKLSVQIANSY